MTTDEKLPSKKFWNDSKVMMQHWENKIRADERRKLGSQNTTNYALGVKDGYAKGKADATIEWSVKTSVANEKAYAKGQVEGIRIGTEQTLKHAKDSHLFKAEYQRGQADLIRKLKEIGYKDNNSAICTMCNAEITAAIKKAGEKP